MREGGGRKGNCRSKTFYLSFEGSTEKLGFLSRLQPTREELVSAGKGSLRGKRSPSNPEGIKAGRTKRRRLSSSSRACGSEKKGKRKTTAEEPGLKKKLAEEWNKGKSGGTHRTGPLGYQRKRETVNQSKHAEVPTKREAQRPANRLWVR